MASVPTFPDVHVFWEITPLGHLTIAIRAPVHYAKSFGSPSDVLYQFLEAVQSRGVGLDHTAEARVRIDRGKGTFVVRWSGHVHQNAELVQQIMPALTQSLGARSYGDG